MSESKSCDCSSAGLCSRRQHTVTPAQYSLCSRGKGGIVDAMIANIGVPVDRPKQCKVRVPDASTVGTDIRSAIEAATGITITCGACLAYLYSLNQTAVHNHAAIVNKLKADVSWPKKWVENQRCFHSAVSNVVGEFVPAPDPPKKDGPRLQFVWPYWAAGAREDELRWSIRSVLKHYLGEAHITIVGDKPVWYSGHFIAKPRIKQCRFHAFADSITKRDLIRKHPEIDATVMMMMDDCYFTQPFTADDFRQGRTNDRKPGNRQDDWNTLLRMTAHELAVRGMPARDYACHIPQIVERNKWIAMYDEFEFAKRPLVWETCYNSMFAVDPQPHNHFLLRLQRPASPKAYNLTRVRMLNHTHEAWCTQVKLWLKSQFPEETQYA